MVFVSPDSDECRPDGPLDAGPADAGDAGDLRDAGPCGTACSGATPVCDAATQMCVGCLSDADCAAPSARCDTTTLNACVACLADADCTDPARARCDDAGACVGCSASAQCMGIAGTEACDVASMTCVQCTPLDASACGANACRPEGRCSMYETEQFECTPCDTDLNCASGRVCVQQTYDNPTPGVVVGSFCAWRRDAPPPGPNGTCGLSSQPYARLDTVTTVDGATGVEICVLATTTCVAFDQHRDPECDTAFSDEQCGAPGQNDGRCRTRLGDGMTLCTYPCGGTEDCPAGFTCPVAGDRFCSI